MHISLLPFLIQVLWENIVQLFCVQFHIPILCPNSEMESILHFNNRWLTALLQHIWQVTGIHRAFLVMVTFSRVPKRSDRLENWLIVFLLNFQHFPPHCSICLVGKSKSQSIILSFNFLFFLTHFGHRVCSNYWIEENVELCVNLIYPSYPPSIPRGQEESAAFFL